MTDEWDWRAGYEFVVTTPQVISVHSQKRVDAINRLGKINLSSKLIVILHNCTVTLPQIIVPDESTASISFFGDGIVKWNEGLVFPRTILFGSRGVSLPNDSATSFPSGTFYANGQVIESSLTPPVPAEIGNEQDTLQNVISSARFALLCGAGVSMALSRSAKTWGGFVDQFARTAQVMLGANEQWLSKVLAMPNILTKVTEITTSMNAHTSGRPAQEIHRLVAQVIFIGQEIDDSFAANVLDSFKSLILTTNYDNLLEKAISISRGSPAPTPAAPMPNVPTPPSGMPSAGPIYPCRVSMSHVEYMRIAGNGEFQNTWGPGPFFGRPHQNLIVHIHGRFFDVGREHGFCLTHHEYEDKAALAAFLAFMVPYARRHSLVFVGATSTWLDHHFQRLWTELTDSDTPHFILCSTDDGDYQALFHNARLLNRLHNINIVVVRFYELSEDSSLRHADLYVKLQALSRLVRR